MRQKAIKTKIKVNTGQVKLEVIIIFVPKQKRVETLLMDTLLR